MGSLRSLSCLPTEPTTSSAILRSLAFFGLLAAAPPTFASSSSSDASSSSISPAALAPPPGGLTLSEFETVFATDVRLELLASASSSSSGGRGSSTLGPSPEEGGALSRGERGGEEEEEELWKSISALEWTGGPFVVGDDDRRRDVVSPRPAAVVEASDDDGGDEKRSSSSASPRRRRPCLVCDYTPRASGVSVLRSLRTVLGAASPKAEGGDDEVSLRAVYNRDDKTCFLTRLSPRSAGVLGEAGFRVQVLPHESKIQTGTLESIASLSSTAAEEEEEEGGSGKKRGEDSGTTVGGHAIVATLCPGSVSVPSVDGDGRVGGVDDGDGLARTMGREVLDSVRSSPRRDGDDDNDDDASSEPTAEREAVPTSRAIQRFLRLRDDDGDPSPSDDDEGNDAVVRPAADRRALWSGALDDARTSSVCRDLFHGHARFAVTVGKGSLSTPRLVVSFLDEPDDGPIEVRPDLPTEGESVPCLLSLVAALSLQSDVCSVSFLRKPETSNKHAQWITQSNVEQNRPFWDVGLTGKGQVVAVSDTGIDTDNCYFHDAKHGDVRKDGKYDENHRKVVQYVAHADASDEDQGHGSHVCGSVAGHRSLDGRTESTGAADGMARDAKIAFIDIGIAGEKGLYIPRDFRKLINTGLQAGAKIHSASWGRPVSPEDKVGNAYSSTDMTIDEYVHGEDEDFLFVTAAGNDGNAFGHDSRNTVGMPATCKNGIAVGATESFGEDLRSQSMLGRDYLAYFSSRGPTWDGRTKPDVVAPGFWIKSAGADIDRKGECDDSGGTHFEAGTSMATPIVSGTAALVRQYFEEGYHPNGKKNAADGFVPSAALVKAVLLNGAQPLVGSNNRPKGDGGPVRRIFPYDVHQNFGRIDLIRSLALDGKNDLKTHVVDKKVIVEDDVHTIAVSIGKCAEPDLSVTLVWSDPPNQPNCRACTLNDLDLFLTKANGDGGGRVFPNGRTNGPRDTLNNAERIRINAKEGDEFLVSVDAHDLSTPTQTYSLVLAGCVAGVTEDATAAPTNTPVPTTFSTKAPVAGLPTADDSKSGFSAMEIAGLAAIIILSLLGTFMCWNCYKRCKYRRVAARADAREASEEAEAARPLPVHMSVRA